MDAEHADAVTARLERQVLGQLDDGGLGHRVGGRQRPAVDAGLAGDVDDATATSGDHVRQDELGGQHETADVDVHRRPPLVELDLPQRSGGTEDPGVVDEQIGRTQLVAEVGHRRGEAGGIGDVGDRGGRDAAVRRDRLEGAVELVAGSGDHGDGRAGVGEGRGDEPTDAPTGARDERHRTPESAGVEAEQAVPPARRTSPRRDRWWWT